MSKEEINNCIARNKAQLARAKADLAILQAGGSVPNLTPEGARENVLGIETCLLHLERLLFAEEPIIRSGCLSS